MKALALVLTWTAGAHKPLQFYGFSSRIETARERIFVVISDVP